MLRITVSKSASGAKKYYTEEYYREGADLGEYYSEKDQIIGNWGGRSAAMIGLSGGIDKKDFAALCDNINPATGERLTGRLNAKRRVGYDFTFNAPKSISLAYAFADEKGKAEILSAFRTSVREAMSEVETGMQVRVRSGGVNANRETGNLAYGEFVHFTSRPVGGVAEPHLHSHIFSFNVSYDVVERKWKAGEFGQIKKDAPYYEAVFHSALASRLSGLGYGIEKKKFGFELSGVGREVIEKFSSRSREIEKLAAEKGINDDKRKSELGARTREDKRVAISSGDELAAWKSRLSSGELSAFSSLKKPVGVNDNFLNGEKVSGRDYVERSIAHLLERKSVTTDKEALGLAIRNSLADMGGSGNAVSWQDIKKGLGESGEVISVREDLVNYVTTFSALEEENKLIAAAHDFKGRFKPLNKNYKPSVDYLNSEQLRAIQGALSSSDGITIIAGKAGTGKTTLMKEVKQGIVEGGKGIFAFAPSAEASRGVQRKEGFSNAETIAALIQNQRLQKKVTGGVIWIDEAGMVGIKDMNAILSIAKENKARLILSGDVRQHNSVQRGDALRILQSEAGIASIQVSKIQRQKNKIYREAVGFLSCGEVNKGFSKLDKMKVIHEVSDKEKRIEMVASDYVSSLYGDSVSGGKKTGKGKKATSVLVVSPTHKEGEMVTAKIREKLKKEGIIESGEREFLSLKNKQLTVVEKQRVENYEAGNFVVFHQNVKGFKAGSRFEIVEGEKKQVGGNENVGASSVLLRRVDKEFVKERIEEKILDLKNVDVERLNVYEPRKINVAKGDKIRITGNGKTNEGVNLFNGNVYRVEDFNYAGDIKLSNGRILSKEFGHVALGYVITSHSSQGKTVDRVIISQGSESLRASSMEQLYVSVSRGRKSVAVYTDDKKELLRAVSQSSERKSARELVGGENKGIKKEALIVDLQRKHLMEQIKRKAYETYNNMKVVMNNGLQRKIQRTK
jgi:conjugative relaxase-like TrwC/TraI family protein